VDAVTRKQRNSGARRRGLRGRRRNRLPVLGDAAIAEAISSLCGAIILEGIHPHSCIRVKGHMGLHVSSEYYVWGPLSREYIGGVEEDE
jgi:hypothetical protein